MANVSQANAAASRRLYAAVTVVVCTAVVVITYRSNRAMERWWKRNHPFAVSKARIAGAKTSYQGKRAAASEVAEVVGGLFAEIANATARARRPA